MRQRLMPLVLVLLGAPFARAGEAAEFACSESGFDEALDAAAAGDPGPHTFACGPAQPLVLSDAKDIATSLILDGQGELVLRGLDARLHPAPPGSVLELGDMALVDPSISFAESTLAVDLHDLSVSGNGGFSAHRLSIRRSVLTYFHAVRPSLLTSQRLFGVRSPQPAPSLEIVDTEISHCDAATSIIDVVEEPDSRLSITDSAIRENVAGRATIRALGVGGLIERSTISGNHAERIGAVWGDVTIENSTLSGNSADNPGPLASGAIAGCPVVRNSTISGNTTPGGYSYSDFSARGRSKSCSDLPIGRATFENTIMDGSCARLGSNAPRSLGGNIEVGGDSCGFSDATDQPDVTPEQLSLGPLADNGGLTATHALRPASVARDAGVFATCTDADQRGVPRPQGADCDSGSYELTDGLEVAVAIGLHRLRQRPLPWSGGFVPVVILGSEAFDARDVDPATLALGEGGALLARRPGSHLADVNRDGFADLLVLFPLRQTDLAFGDGEACITGALRDGTLFEGCDAITTVLRRGHRRPVHGRGPGA